MTSRRRRQRWRTWLPATLVVVLALTGALVVVAALRTAPVTTGRSVTVLSGDWAPYAGADLPGGGPATRILRDVLELAGFDPDVQYTTWESAEQRVSAGAAFAAFPLVFSEGRRERVRFTDPVLDFEYVMFYRASTPAPPVTTLAELERVRVGGIAGYDYWPELDDAVSEMTRYLSTEAGLLALAEGEIDVLVEGRLPGETALRSGSLALDATRFAVIDAPWARSVQNLYFILPDRPETSAVREALNAAIAQYRETVDYARALEEIQGEADAVVLVPDPETGLVPVLDADGGLRVQAVGGTHARVLEWPAALVPDAGASADDARVRVKLTDGPSAGLIGFVAVRNVEMAGR